MSSSSGPALRFRHRRTLRRGGAPRPDPRGRPGEAPGPDDQLDAARAAPEVVLARRSSRKVRIPSATSSMPRMAPAERHCITMPCGRGCIRRTSRSARAFSRCGLDWPFGYDELAPWHSLSGRVWRLGETRARKRARRGRPIPRPAGARVPAGRAIARGFHKLGSPAPLRCRSPSPPVTTGAVWPASGTAGATRAVLFGALANPLTVYLPRARAAGAVLVNDAPVVSNPDDDDWGGRATGVEVATPAMARTCRPASSRRPPSPSRTRAPPRLG